MTTGGGSVAAFGFRYQYLAGAEEILRLLLSGEYDIERIALMIEPLRREHNSESNSDNDIIDFAIRLDGSLHRRVQMKASTAPDKYPLGKTDAIKIFTRLDVGIVVPPSSVEILTNKPPRPNLSKECSPPNRDVHGRDVYRLQSTDIADVTKWDHFVVHDARQISDIKNSVFELIRKLRQDQALGRGILSAGLLTALLLDTIFDLAATVPRELSGRELLQLLAVRDVDLAHALGRFDWGLSINEIPQLTSVVPRTAELAELTELFHESIDGRTPKISVLTGVTGFGKSSVVADFCLLNKHFYEYVSWIDCANPRTIKSKIRDTAVKLGATLTEDSDVIDAFHSAFAASGGPTVIVFDGAKQREDIEHYIPSNGCGFIVVTSNSSGSWWPRGTAHQRAIEAFSQEEADACFASYAGLEVGSQQDVISEITNRLGRVPLAVCMAGQYFRNCDEDVSRLSVEYFKRLDALDDLPSKPQGFDKTAFAAIRLAVEQLGADGSIAERERREIQILVYRSSFIAPELIPLNLLIQAIDQEALNLATPPKPEFTEQHRLNRIVSTIRTQTLARRRNYVDASGKSTPASDTITIHPLVHEILREIFSHAAPPEHVEDVLGMLMGCLYGWIRELRPAGTYLAVDQLIIHSEQLLNVADSRNNADNVIPYRCAKLFLRWELSRSYSSRGQHAESVDMTEKALNDTQGLNLAPYPRSIRANAVAGIIFDALKLGDPDRALRFAHQAVAELEALESFGLKEYAERIHEVAQMAISSIEKSSQRPISSDMQAVTTKLRSIRARQRVSGQRPKSDVIIAFENMMKIRRYADALAAVETLRQRSSNADQEFMCDSFEARVDLYLGHFPKAAQMIERVLVIARDSRYMQMAVYVALPEIEKALRETQPNWRGQSAELINQLTEIRDVIRNRLRGS